MSKPEEDAAKIEVLLGLASAIQPWWTATEVLDWIQEASKKLANNQESN